MARKKVTMVPRSNPSPVRRKKRSRGLVRRRAVSRTPIAGVVAERSIGAKLDAMGLDGRISREHGEIWIRMSRDEYHRALNAEFSRALVPIAKRHGYIVLRDPLKAAFVLKGPGGVKSNPSAKKRSRGLVRRNASRPSRARYPHAPPALRAKWERCVRKVKARKGKKPYSPWAVCTKSISRGRHYNFRKPSGAKVLPFRARTAPRASGGLRRVANPSVYAQDLQPGDTIQLEFGREHIIEGPYRSARGIRFVDQHGTSILLRPNEVVQRVGRANPSRAIVRRSPKRSRKARKARNPVRGMRYEVWVRRGKSAVPVHATDIQSDANDRAHMLITRGHHAYVQDAATGRIVGPFSHAQMRRMAAMR
jgi:hypothetical protein